MTKSRGITPTFLSKSRGITSPFLTKSRGINPTFSTKSRGMSFAFFHCNIGAQTNHLGEVRPLINNTVQAEGAVPCHSVIQRPTLLTL